MTGTSRNSLRLVANDAQADRNNPARQQGSGPDNFNRLQAGAALPNNVNNDGVRILNSNAVFDHNYHELYISIPVQYRDNIINFISDKKDRLSTIIRHEFNNTTFDNIGIQIKFTIEIVKQNINDIETNQNIYIQTPRYICTFNEIINVLDVIITYLIDRIAASLRNIEGSGFTVQKFDNFIVVVHRVFRINNPGFYGVKYPVNRTQDFVYNSRGNNERDFMCFADL